MHPQKKGTDRLFKCSINHEQN